MCGPSPYNPIVSASGALLRDVLVGVVGHQQRGDDADDSAKSDVAGNDVARCGYCPGPSQQRRGNERGRPPAVIEASLRAALVEFARRYNETWLVAWHGYRTPAQGEPINAGLIRTLRPI